MLWVGFTVFAAFMQSWRNAFQSKLSKDVSALGVTLARFIWASPIALCYLAGLYLWQPVAMPDFSAKFFGFIVAASLMQILATALMVKLFQYQNYAVGAGLAKSEALVAAILGMFFFGTTLSLLGWVGVMLGGVAVFMLSSAKGFKGLSFNIVAIGLASGTAFALTSLWIREASLNLDLPFPHRAAWVLLLVISLQTVLLLAYLMHKDRASIVALWQRPKLTLLTSIASCLGSIGWFSAMSLQAVPYVKTLGQVEIFFTMLISLLWLGEKVKVKDILGLVLIAVAAIMVMWQ
jgi:drug/metabolite transporter (DMT)-like permease